MCVCVCVSQELGLPACALQVPQGWNSVAQPASCSCPVGRASTESGPPCSPVLHQKSRAHSIGGHLRQMRWTLKENQGGNRSPFDELHLLCCCSGWRAVGDSWWAWHRGAWSSQRQALPLTLPQCSSAPHPFLSLRWFLCLGAISWLWNSSIFPHTRADSSCKLLADPAASPTDLACFMLQLRACTCSLIFPPCSLWVLCSQSCCNSWAGTCWGTGGQQSSRNAVWDSHFEHSAPTTGFWVQCLLKGRPEKHLVF